MCIFSLFCNKGKDLRIQFSCQYNCIVFIVYMYSIHFAGNKDPKKYLSRNSRSCHESIIRNTRITLNIAFAKGKQRQYQLKGDVESRDHSVWLTVTVLKNVCAFCSFLEISCRGERIRDYYQKQQGYAACQTTKKVSRLECKGGCAGGQCCGPLRSKRRKYSFECTDGSSFVDEVEKVVKCGCMRCVS
jgi:hypothetical protein